MPVMPALKRLRHKDSDFQTIPVKLHKNILYQSFHYLISVKGVYIERHKEKWQREKGNAETLGTLGYKLAE